MVLGGAIAINCNNAMADVILSPDWRPGTNNSGVGAATVSGKTEYIALGPNVVQSGGSGLIWMTVEQAILNGYTTGDNLSGLIYVNTGEAYGSLLTTMFFLVPFFHRKGPVK